MKFSFCRILQKPKFQTRSIQDRSSNDIYSTPIKANQYSLDFKSKMNPVAAQYCRNFHKILTEFIIKIMHIIKEKLTGPIAVLNLQTFHTIMLKNILFSYESDKRKQLSEKRKHHERKYSSFS